MIKKRGKKAQFYLVASVIIVVIIFGVVAVTNYIIIREEPEEFFDLTEVLDREGPEVISNMIYEAGSPQEIENRIDTFTSLFATYTLEKQGEFRLVIISGTIDKATAKIYNSKSTGGVNVGGLTPSPISLSSAKEINEKSETITPNADGSVNLVIDNTEYGPYNLTQGQNFLFVMSTANEFNESYVVQSESA